MAAFFDKLLSPGVVWVLIPVLAIVGVFAKQMLNRYFDHKERMARIEAGLDTDVDEDDAG
jgi:hypothetical protein